MLDEVRPSVCHHRQSVLSAHPFVMEQVAMECHEGNQGLRDLDLILARFDLRQATEILKASDASSQKQGN